MLCNYEKLVVVWVCFVLFYPIDVYIEERREKMAGESQMTASSMPLSLILALAIKIKKH